MKSINLSKQTLRVLTAHESAQVAGGEGGAPSGRPDQPCNPPPQSQFCPSTRVTNCVPRPSEHKPLCWVATG